MPVVFGTSWGAMALELVAALRCAVRVQSCPSRECELHMAVRWCGVAGGAPGYFALLIGVNNYLAMPSLRCAEADAESLREVLFQCGYTTFLVTGRTPTETSRCPVGRQEIEAAVQRLCAAVTHGSTVVVSFSGHGLQRDGSDYLVPADGCDDTSSGACHALIWSQKDETLLLHTCHLLELLSSPRPHPLLCFCRKQP
jgi:hypothetical protein